MDLQNFHVTFAVGIVETLMCTTKGEYGQKNKFSVGKNVKWDPLIDPSKILMPPLHIKLGSSNNLLKL